MSDRRTLLAGARVADVRLEGLSAAETYAPAMTMHCRVPATALHTAPDGASEMPDQLLFGEIFDVLEQGGDWCFGQSRRDGYVGHVRGWALAEGAREPSHRVAALRACAYSKPDVTTPVRSHYGLNALVRIETEEGRFGHDPEAGYFVMEQLSAVGRVETDPASVAERFLGAPYQWGARDGLGIDCSGLIQQALNACGYACPRDTDQQLAALGRAVDLGELRRGDLVFWPGHVGMMVDAERLIHASGELAAVVAEPLANAVERIRRSGRGGPVAFRRL